MQMPETNSYNKLFQNSCVDTVKGENLALFRHQSSRPASQAEINYNKLLSSWQATTIVIYIVQPV